MAVIGASTDPNKPSGRTLRYLKHYGFTGRAYAVNPHRTEVQGFQSFASVKDVPEPVDLAMIVARADQVISNLRECVESNVKSVIIVSAGFAEVGKEGFHMQQELKKVLEGGNTRVLGPNCVGIVSTRVNLAATINTGLDQNRFQFKNSDVALVSQSGAMGAFIFSQVQGKGVGLGSMLSTGNEMDVSLTDMLNASIDDPEVSSIVGYIEGIRDGEKFLATLERAKKARKPIAMLKAGRTEIGQKAITSHTGVLAGSDSIYDAVFDHYGVHRLDTIRELGEYVEIASSGNTITGNRMTVLTTSGGAGILTADYSERYGLTFSNWNDEWQQKLSQHLPSFAALSNPIDMTGAGGRPEILAPVLDIACSHPETDTLLLILGNLENNEDALIRLITEKSKTSPIPIIVVWVGGSGKPAKVLSGRGVPIYTDPLDAVKAIAARHSTPNEDEVEKITVNNVRKELALEIVREAPSGSSLNEVQIKKILQLYNIPTVKETVAETSKELSEKSKEIGFPLVLKALHDQIPHKTELGGVIVGIQSDEELNRSAEKMSKHILKETGLVIEFTLQEMVSDGFEMLIGTRKDADFGHMLVIGSGGVQTEILKDSVITLPVLSKTLISQKINELKASKILDGFRGQKPLDRQALIDTILKIVVMIHEIGECIEDFEINPLIVKENEKGCIAVDALLFSTKIEEENERRRT